MENLALSKQLLEKLISLCRKATDKVGRRITLMEVCGTHTTAISKSGLRSLLSEYMELLSGPGCPVCVTDQKDIDKSIALARLPGIVIATFGDMVRIPGSNSSLEQEKARGAQVEVFYSPHDAVAYARKHQNREIIFLGVGFETTIPAVAMSISEAMSQNIKNYVVFSVHKLVPPAMHTLLHDHELRVDGFILPGHVCTITGRKAFDFIGSEYHLPSVIAGFESVDIMQAIYLLLQQIVSGTAATTIGYTRLVHEEGNIRARAIIDRFFDPTDACWRGFGSIPASGLLIKKDYSRYDATVRFPVDVPESSTTEGCSCGEILKGKLKPSQCPLFGSVCTPSDPIGPCMVSSEGACAAYYQYG